MPGDHVIITGVFLPFLKSGFNARSGPALASETYLDAHVRISILILVLILIIFYSLSIIIKFLYLIPCLILESNMPQ